MVDYDHKSNNLQYRKMEQWINGLIIPLPDGPMFSLIIRAVARSENLGVPVLFGGHNLSPLVEIGLTDMSKSGGAMAPPAPSGTTPLYSFPVLSLFHTYY